MKINPKEDQAYIKALNQISYRPRSIFEVRSFLSRREVSPKLIDKTIKKLENQGYLNDLEFSRWFISSRLKDRGPILIKRELTSKGVDPNLTSQVLQELSTNQELESTATNLLRKKHFNLSDPKENHKATQYLLRRGFPLNLVRKLIPLEFD